ncbi:cell division cycle protein 20 homolog B [Rhinatrema bivittatum]|uniref:cell division cycle protein 20 homolog B n=1 Tax=Rhinatrema bivittatum TaxID=194408 RepID=UPI001129601F|nr:cell division cycle protein 20 homolog B [Rhinatrema bivittatum]
MFMQMDWKLERIACRKIKTEEAMTWENIMKKLAKDFKRSRRHSLPKLNKALLKEVPDAGKTSYHRFKSNIVKRLQFKVPVASSPIATRWQQSHARNQREGTLLGNQSKDPLPLFKTPEKMIAVPASPTLLINTCTSGPQQTVFSAVRCHNRKATVQVKNERKRDTSKKQLQKSLAQLTFTQEKGSDADTGFMDICRNNACSHKGCENRSNKDESSNQTIFKNHIESMQLKIKLHIRGLRNDYYLNILDWSSENLVAIALDSTVQIWDGEKHTVTESINLTTGLKYVSSVSWIKEGTCLAIGTSDGEVQLWDVETKKRLRNMLGHKSLVGVMSWNSYILSSGSRLGLIHQHDVRAAEHHIGMMRHKQSICSLQWAPGGEVLASGSSDGILNIWPNDPGVTMHCEPIITIPHSSAVKAMSWCPWLPDTLAVGGGMRDGGLHIWDIRGQSIKTTDTKSQICSLLWLPETEELVTGQGLPENQMTFWNYPSLTKATDIHSHRGRVLHLALSPDHQKIFSAAADGTACIWSYCKQI